MTARGTDLSGATATAGTRIARIAAVIPCFNRQSDVDALLADLTCVAAQGREFHVIVVDNASTPPLSIGLHVAAFARLGMTAEVLRLGTNGGGAGGFSAGIAHALESPRSFDAIWLLDSDARVEAGTLAPLIEVLEHRGDVVGAGSLLEDSVTGFVYEIGGKFARRAGMNVPAARGQCDTDLVLGCDYVAACSALVRREGFVAGGLFPPVFLNCDDIAWCVRAARATSKKFVAVAASRARHPWQKFPVAVRYYGARNAYTAIGAARLGASTRLLRGVFETMQAVACVLFGEPQLAELHLRGLSDAAAGTLTGPMPGAAAVGPRMIPLREVWGEVSRLLGRDAARIDVHPHLLPAVLGRGGLRETLEVMGWEPTRLEPWKGERPAEVMIGDAARCVWRLIAGPRADVVFASAGWPLAWARGRVLVAVCGQSAMVAEVRVWSRARTAARVLVRGVGLSIRLSVRAPAAAENPPALSVGRAETDAQVH